MTTLEQLRKKLGELKAALEAIPKAADSAGRELTEEECAKVDSLIAEFDSVQAQIERREKMEARIAIAGQSAGRRTGTGHGVRMVGERSDQDPMRGFKTQAEFARSVMAACRPGSAQVDERLLRMRGSDGHGGVLAAPSNWQSESVGADGGFLLPPAMRDEIWELVFDARDIMNFVQWEPTESNAVQLLADETTPWGASGVRAKWRAEAAQMTSTGKAVVDPRMVVLHELYAFILATDELLEDAPRLESRLTTKAAQAIRWEASEAIMWGSGAGKPLGFCAGGSLVAVAKESGQAAATIVRANLLKMLSRVLRMGGGPLVWFANPDTMPALGELTLGQNGLFFLPQTGFSAAPSTTLLGIPIEFNDHPKTLGTQGDIVLADMQGYYGVNKGGGAKYDTSIHLFFDYGLTAFRWTFRIGGQPFLKSAVTPANGSSTRSHFVALADRA